MNYKKYFNYLVSWLKEEVEKANMKGVIVGLSGGIDSSLVAVIAKKAFPNNSLGVILPINSMKNDKDDIKKLVSKFEIESIEINLKSTYDMLLSQIPLNDKLAIANIKPRLRMTTLYALAQEKKYLVLGTDNFSEMFLGYFTKYGDGGVDLLPIVQLTKYQVRQLSKELNIPESIISKVPTAGLWDGQSDEQELGFTYDDFDQYLKDKSKLSEKIINLIEKQHKITEHKRSPLPRPKKPEDIL
ncbi:NAD(+) synthase [Mesomycoplasma lagogenitalium]|uniref:NH(3)-dependent NAD(+) synthetase n=1 Tax=Mesomycoplasma lagogenitalium TaxID=171286 RepID=A0ABY8LVG5_9BACT|nr:NAD(+) synthase [Mesomycoplasma lagogenitalium]WGI36288.1 NAD(+) synthase [Mesomycoplasma lagogenitalium]